MDDLHRELALLTDAEARNALNRIIAGAAATEPEYERLISSPDDLSTMVSSVADEVGLPVPAELVGSSSDELKGTRQLLVAMAEDPALSGRVAAALAVKRATLLEPVTSALVLAGIALVLSIHVDVRYESDGTKHKLKVHVEKKPTSAGIIGKFFSLFN